MKMQDFVLGTFLGLVATSIAAAVPDDASLWTRTLAKKGDGILVTLCNDFHGGKPCETHDVWPGQCTKWEGNVDSNLYKYVSSVKIGASNEHCTFYGEKNCKGDKIVVYYPGDVDLAVDENFDNQIVSYSCGHNQ